MYLVGNVIALTPLLRVNTISSDGKKMSAESKGATTLLSRACVVKINSVFIYHMLWFIAIGSGAIQRQCVTPCGRITIIVR